jgi:cytochrome P450
MTTIGALGWFILAMVLYPEVQFRAQAELDRVVGRERLPTFEDYKDMPYMQAMVSRWLFTKIRTRMSILTNSPSRYEKSCDGVR